MEGRSWHSFVVSDMWGLHNFTSMVGIFMKVHEPGSLDPMLSLLITHSSPD